MKRLLLIMIALLLICFPASAHTPALEAKVTIVGTHITVELRDAYRAPIEAIPLTAAVGQIGKTPSGAGLLKESKPGVYEGELSLPATGPYAITLEAEFGGEHFHGALPATAGEDVTLQVGLEEYVPQGYTLRDMALFGGAVLVLAGTGVMMFLRRRKA